MITTRPTMPRDVLDTLITEGKIDHLQYVMNTEHNVDFINWCKDMNCPPDKENAEFFCEMTFFDVQEHQYIDSEAHGIWI